jgi:hypothetical protein
MFFEEASARSQAIKESFLVSVTESAARENVRRGQ